MSMYVCAVFHLGGGSPGISPLKCWEKLLISDQNGPKLPP